MPSQPAQVQSNSGPPPVSNPSLASDGLQANGATAPPAPAPSAAAPAIPDTAGGAGARSAARPFEDVDLGEGGLGIKLVRLKGIKASGKISEAHFEWALKRLLRVRAFGCPGEHELIKSATNLEGWTCNVCDKALALGTTIYSCRDCDWDGCR